MNQMSCKVCLDLIPLVKDGIASDDSCALVMAHIQTCELCAHAYGTNPTVDPTMDDGIVLTKIKRQFALLFLGVAVAGALIGLALSEGMGMFYNVLIMPAIGGLGYALLKKKTYVVPIGLFVFLFISIAIREMAKGFLTSLPIGRLFIVAASGAAIYAALCAVGVLIAWLLHYAFKKEG